MSGDIISKRTRLAFREHFTGWTLHQITMAFDGADIGCDLEYQPSEGGQRRCLVERYYRTLDFSDQRDMRKLLMVYESALDQLEEAAGTEPRPAESKTWATDALRKLSRSLARDGFAYERGRILHNGHIASLPSVHEAAAGFDVPELQGQLARLRHAVQDDPGLAIGTAEELVETTCKTILHARGVAFDDHADISELVKATRKTLELLPTDVPEAAKGADTIRRLLSNLGTVAQALGELRNLYGTGHGKVGRATGLSAATRVSRSEALPRLQRSCSKPMKPAL